MSLLLTAQPLYGALGRQVLYGSHMDHSSTSLFSPDKWCVAMLMVPKD